MTHIPCPDCDTGWLWPEPGHTHLRPCPTCRGTGYLTDHRRGEREDRRIPGHGPASETAHRSAPAVGRATGWQT